MSATCENCGTAPPLRFKVLDDDEKGPGTLRTYYLCSVSCLVEYGWKLREQQPKLSKSKQGDS